MTRIVETLDDFYAGEEDVVTFDFTDRFDAGSAFGVATANVSVETVYGVDASPGTIKVNAAQPQGMVAMQKFLPTIAGVQYLLVCTAVTNEASPRTLKQAAVLTVVNPSRS